MSTKGKGVFACCVLAYPFLILSTWLAIQGHYLWYAGSTFWGVVCWLPMGCIIAVASVGGVLMIGAQIYCLYLLAGAERAMRKEMGDDFWMLHS